MKSKTNRQTISEAIEQLKNASINDPERTALGILSHLTNKSATKIIQDYDMPMSESTTAQFVDLVKRRANGEPLQYIFGEWEFYGRSFYLNPEVFIPRPETEFIIDAVKKFFDGNSQLRILDIATGSGAIAITLALEFDRSTVVATDISEDALKTAKRSAKKYKINKRIEFITSDALTALRAEAKFEVITCNPPYVPDREYEGLQKEITDWEPKIALTGGIDGLDFIRRLLNGSTRAKPLCEYLNDDGLFFCEIGYRQFEQMTGIAKSVPGLKPLEVVEDYNGIPRTVILRKN